MKAVGYVRVSTDEQAREGISLDNQVEKVKAFCKAKDWELVDIIADEGRSGKDLNRPGIQQVIRGCKKKAFGVLIVCKLDRLTRNVRDLGYLIQDVFEKNGVGFSSIADNFDTTTANGKLVLNVLGSVAQWEREIISERTREALHFKREKRELYGMVPLGFDLEGDRLIPNPKELDTVKYVKSLREKRLSLQKIANRLNLEGIKTKLGGRWFGSTVRYLLGNPIYQGI